MVLATYPARVGIQKPPPDTICADLFHPSAPVQENCQHALSEIDYLLILLCVGGVGGILGHGMLFGNRRYDEGRM
jgi:hypothetical protein